MAVTVSCKCGDRKVFFKNLTEADFPNGLTEDCCTEKTKVTTTLPEIMATAPIVEEESIFDRKKRGRPKSK